MQNSHDSTASDFGGLQEYRRSKRPAILTMPFPKWPPPFFEVETRPQHPRWRAFFAWHAHEGHKKRIFTITAVAIYRRGMGK